MFNPQAASFAMMRQLLGGSPAATEADPGAFARMMSGSEHTRPMFDLLKADEDGGQGEGHWAEYLRLAFHRSTQPPGYAFEDLAKIGAPTLILVGDRDDYCTLDDGLAAYRQLAHGEIAVLPYRAHHHARQDRPDHQLLRPAPASERPQPVTVSEVTAKVLPPPYGASTPYSTSRMPSSDDGT